MRSADVVVVGAGVAGVACAQYLAAGWGAEVVLVDPRPPFTLPSSQAASWPELPQDCSLLPPAAPP